VSIMWMYAVQGLRCPNRGWCLLRLWWTGH